MQTITIILLFLSVLINIALVIYFTSVIERLFTLTKAGTLKDLLTYKAEQKKLNARTAQDLIKMEEDEDFMP